MDDEQMDKVRKQLETILDPAFTTESGKTYTVERLDMVSSQVRNTVAQIVRVMAPEAYEEYRALKYKSGPNPTLAERHEAYQFLWAEFLRVSYRIPGV